MNNKTIKFNNKDFFVLKNLNPGGGSDSISVVLEKEKYNRIFYELQESLKSTTLDSLDQNYNTAINNYISYEKIDTTIKNYINNKNLDKIEKNILKRITGEYYSRRIKIYNKAIRFAKKCQIQDVKIEKPEDNTALYVIKKYNTKKLNDLKWETRFKNEIKFAKEAKCKNVIKYLDSEDIDNNGTPSLCALMPFYPKTLREIIINKENYSYETRLKMIQQLCQALKYIHGKKMWHRDIKPENILVDDHNNIVLADFGIAHFPDFYITENSDDFKNRAYAAPEQLIKKNHDNIGPHTDIYSFGLIINELFTGKVPRGSDYEKIADYYPPYRWMDSLVSLMTKDSIDDRISDINYVISEISINKFKTRTEKLNTTLVNIINSTSFIGKIFFLQKKERNAILNLIKNDSLKAKDIFETKSDEE